MDKEEIKQKCDLNNIQEKTRIDTFGIEHKLDYIIDESGNAIIPVPPLLFKLIEKIHELEARIIELEKL